MQYLILFLLFFSASLFSDLYEYIPRSKAHVDKKSLTSWLLWSFLGNDDDGIYGENPSAGNWSQEKIGTKRAIKWWIRNPMHNFTFYVIGSAHKVNSEFILFKLSEDEPAEFFTYRSKGKTVFAGKGTGFFLGFHGGKPFLSIRLDYGRRLDFYIGWRERGNFGLKLNPSGRSLRLKGKKCYSLSKNYYRIKKYGREKKIQNSCHWRRTCRVCGGHSSSSLRSKCSAH